MRTSKQRAASQRLDEIDQHLDEDERRIIASMVEQRRGLLTTARAMRLRKEEAMELLRRALDKVDLAYAEIDAREARAAGAIQ